MIPSDFTNWWYYKKGIISKTPPYRPVVVDKKALFHHFKHAFYIRWSSDYDQTENQNYYQVVKDGNFQLESLPPKTRNMVRRCLKNCEIRLVDYQYIVNTGGYRIYASEYQRYARKGYASVPKDEQGWTAGMKEAESRGQEFWAVINEGLIIAYSICWRNDQHVDLVTWKVDYDNYSQLYPSYGLVYSMCDYYLNHEGFRFVNDGGRSLTGHSSVQDFLMDKFGFRKAYTKLNTVFKWYLIPPLMLLSPFENKIKNNAIYSLVRLYKWSR